MFVMLFGFAPVAERGADDHDVLGHERRGVQPDVAASSRSML